MLKYTRLLRIGCAIGAAWLALAPSAAAADGAAWTRWQSFKGVFDVGGPRADGRLVVAGSAALYLVDVAGNQTPFARGPGGYRDDAGAEAYLAVSPGGHVAAAGCDFTPDEVFVLRVHVPLGITRVSAAGDESRSFANLPGVASLNGIVFDATGSFDHRLLVTGASGGKTTIFAVDCNGTVSVVTRGAPVMEGGLAVAPASFGAFGGDLIAPDELSGNIYAVAPDGKVSVVVRPALDVGQDIGVESLGFVPQGFVSRGGAVYYADRATAGNPHPGTDHLLQLASADAAAAGVQEGDMLVATEGGAALTAVRCGSFCTSLAVVGPGKTPHGEGHVAFTVNPPLPSPVSTASARPAVVPLLGGDAGGWGVAAAVAVVAALALLVVVAALRRRPR